MEQPFSHGLLYSVSPENLSELHLKEEETADQLEWERQESLISKLLGAVLARLK